MRKGIIGILSMAFVLAACSPSSSSTGPDAKSAEFERTAALIESGNYLFTVRSASPTGARTIQITSTYVMKVEDGNFEANLPYFGRVYSGTYGDGGSIIFNGKPGDLQIERNDKRRRITLSFTIDSATDKYDVQLSVGASGFGSLVVSGAKRSSISYSGVATALSD